METLSEELQLQLFSIFLFVIFTCSINNSENTESICGDVEPPGIDQIYIQWQSTEDKSKKVEE